MNSRSFSKLVRILGACGLLWMAGIRPAFASVVPEMDPGSAATGITLAIGAALLLAERYRHRD